MPALEIRTGQKPYMVHIGSGIRHQSAQHLTRAYSAVLIITDSIVADLYLSDVVDSFAEYSAPIYTEVVPAGEASKNQHQYYQLQTRAIELGLDRRSLIVALGGGVIGDLAGYVAATFMRGIDFVQIPTTILAHDSSVGGKVGINHEKGKNLIGSFHQPAAVIYDVESLLSLPEREVRSGYAEVIKHGLIEDVNLFEELMESFSLSNITPDLLQKHLQKGIAVKAAIVEKDEKESNIRKYLNFGHTLGHAIEAELGYGSITHGEAVAVGMLFALRVSQEKFRVELPYVRLKEWLIQNGYPLAIENVTIDNLIKKMKHDKKAEKGVIQMVLLEKTGKPVIRELDDQYVKQEVKDFFREMMDK